MPKSAEDDATRLSGRFVQAKRSQCKAAPHVTPSHALHIPRILFEQNPMRRSRQRIRNNNGRRLSLLVLGRGGECRVREVPSPYFRANATLGGCSGSGYSGRLYLHYFVLQHHVRCDCPTTALIFFSFFPLERPGLCLNVTGEGTCLEISRPGGRFLGAGVLVPERDTHTRIVWKR